MILDQFGKPTNRAVSFESAEWLMRDMKRQAVDWEADRRIRELRNSVAFAEMTSAPLLLGQTIRVRLPKRFDRLQSPAPVSHTETPT